MPHNNGIVTECTLCENSYYRKNIVNGIGNANSDIMIIGESPGYYEDKTGKPFTGYGGIHLNTILNFVGFKPKDVYLTNVIKCKPRRKKLSMKEINNCAKHLTAELRNVKPSIVILLGRTAHNSILGKSNRSMSYLTKQVVITKNNTYIFTMYHPSYILANPDLNVHYVKSFTKIYDVYIKHFNPFYKFKNLLTYG